MIFDINNANITANSDEKVDIDFSFFTSDDAKSIVPVDNTTDMAKSKKRKRVSGGGDTSCLYGLQKRSDDHRSG